MPAVTQQRFVDMRIADVVKAPTPAPADCYVVLLEERGGERQRLLIWIGGGEATRWRCAWPGWAGRPGRWART
jgi:hypothetical protein